MTNAITTIPDLVAALGGWSCVAKWAGYEDARGVYNWVSRGIPHSYHLRLVLELARRGLAVDPVVFDLPEQDSTVLRRAMPILQREVCGAQP